MGTHNNAKNNNPKAKEEIRLGMPKLNLVDVWREKNQNNFKFTWGMQNPAKKSKTGLLSNFSTPFNVTAECKIGCKYRSDHAPVQLKLMTLEHFIGPGVWKLNVKLLESRELETKVLKEILLIKETYMRPLPIIQITFNLAQTVAFN